jgi:serine/threonine protein kinase
MLERAFPLSPIDKLSIRKFRRLYSTIWVISTFHNGIRCDYIVKDAGERGEKQARLSGRADEIFRGDPLHFSATVAYEPTYNVLISRKYEGPSLQTLMAQPALPYPIGWYHRVTEFLCRAGTWLRRYHSADCHAGSISGALMCYIEQRRRKLDQLPSDTRQRLLRLIQRRLVDDIAVVHGDFSPANILSDGRTICVIDFGISEWTQMSVWWDVATLLVGLDRYFLFRKSGPLYWIRPLLTKMKATFLRAYSRSTLQECDNEALLVCMAVRHFTFAAGRSTISRADARDQWHLVQLERLLSRF